MSDENHHFVLSLALQSRQPAVGDFDGCVQSADCVFTCFYHSERGDYNLAAAGDTIASGRGILSTR